jgi:hypothetical protein
MQMRDSLEEETKDVYYFPRIEAGELVLVLNHKIGPQLYHIDIRPCAPRPSSGASQYTTDAITFTIKSKFSASHRLEQITINPVKEAKVKLFLCFIRHHNMKTGGRYSHSWLHVPATLPPAPKENTSVVLAG